MPSLGIDLGVTSFAATSKGVLVAPLNALKQQERRLRHYQRALARKVKGSCNSKKARAKLSRLHQHVAQQRNDWMHKLSSNLASEHPIIAIEDLRVKNMSASARGDAAAPGRNVRAKAGLNKSILDQSWAEFRRQLQYKLAANGGQLVAVNPAYTSCTCRICDHRDKDNRKTQAVFCCVACGHAEQADIHAAKVILARALLAFEIALEDQDKLAAGHAVHACGGDVRRSKRSAAPVKQELAEVATQGLALT
jgi:putative transposase